MTDARILLWGRDIAAVTWLEDRGHAVFEYAPEFVPSGIEVSPLVMPLRLGTFEFPALSKDAFTGLPGLLADSLPDKFGNALIDAWLAQEGRTPASFNPVERLCYIGTRGMGGLEFQPAVLNEPSAQHDIQVASLVRLASTVLSERNTLAGKFTGDDDSEAIQDILRVGTSAGGARAKAILAWNEQTGQFRSGQIQSGDGFTQWVIKFDGISNNKDKELADPQGYGLIEFAYSLMASDAGIEMSRCRLHKENGRSHFMTQRFDRTEAGETLHMQSLGAMMHFDFNQPTAYSYEQALQTILRLGLSVRECQQQYRRAVFNAIARNQDDHVKNIAFLMNKQGVWQLSPAFDVAYSYNPAGMWTSQHQMSINGKRDAFELDDFVMLANVGGIKKRRAIEIVDQVTRAVLRWEEHAAAAGIRPEVAQQIAATFRLSILPS